MKEARLNAGMTQAELAKKTSRTQAYISKFEANQLRLDVADFLVFCTALDIEPNKVIDQLVVVEEL
ncbi:MAG: helix-turn-helix transcriptional regulator [Pseudomonadota bacterium]